MIFHNKRVEEVKGQENQENQENQEKQENQENQENQEESNKFLVNTFLFIMKKDISHKIITL